MMDLAELFDDDLAEKRLSDSRCGKLPSASRQTVVQVDLPAFASEFKGATECAAARFRFREGDLAEFLALWVWLLGPLPTYCGELLDDLSHETGVVDVDNAARRMRHLLVTMLAGKPLSEFLTAIAGTGHNGYVIVRDERGWLSVSPPAVNPNDGEIAF